MARDTIRLGIALRGTIGAWLAAWGGSVVLMAVIGAVAAAIAFRTARFAGRATRTASLFLPVTGFAVAAGCFWVDWVESRSLQAAPPDTCFLHGVFHAVHAPPSRTAAGGCTVRRVLPPRAAASAQARAARAPS